MKNLRKNVRIAITFLVSLIISLILFAVSAVFVLVLSYKEENQAGFEALEVARVEEKREVLIIFDFAQSVRFVAVKMFFDQGNFVCENMSNYSDMQNAYSSGGASQAVKLYNYRQGGLADKYIVLNEQALENVCNLLGGAEVEILGETVRLMGAQAVEKFGSDYTELQITAAILNKFFDCDEAQALLTKFLQAEKLVKTNISYTHVFDTADSLCGLKGG
ncbi:MAG: hypothetical protein Q4B04_02145 [bacterium]|nr:hypothetical protein [bacterium]